MTHPGSETIVLPIDVHESVHCRIHLPPRMRARSLVHSVLGNRLLEAIIWFDGRGKKCFWKCAFPSSLQSVSITLLHKNSLIIGTDDSEISKRGFAPRFLFARVFIFCVHKNIQYTPQRRAEYEVYWIFLSLSMVHSEDLYNCENLYD